MSYKYEYIWLDGNEKEPGLRSKTKVLPEGLKLQELPVWFYDGSSTGQAEGRYSDLMLKPVRMYPDPGRVNAFLVLCEVCNPDGTPHPTNSRFLVDENEDLDFWFGFEQEYVIVDPNTMLPIGFPERGYPKPQGDYYCGVGHHIISGRDIVEEHLNACLDAGLNITGINAEVMLGQWEFQVFNKGAKHSADDVWIARYLLYRITEKYKYILEFHPKPVEGDWNGSGMHTNFSNKPMREQGGKEWFDKLFKAFEEKHLDHIAVYGSDNEMRLTGKHETAPISQFSWGISDRGSSIRVPQSTVQSGWKGYLEDRRPASSADPYRIVSRIIKTMEEL